MKTYEAAAAYSATARASGSSAWRLTVLGSLCLVACASNDSIQPSGPPGSAGTLSGAGASSAAGVAGASAGTSSVGAGGGGDFAGSGNALGGSGGSTSGSSNGGKAGDAGGSGGSVAVGCGKSTGADPLIDDLEDNNLMVSPSDGRGGVWETFNDGAMGASFAPRAPTAMLGRNSSVGYCVSVSGFSQWGADLVVNMNDPKCGYDASPYKGVCFWARGKVDLGGPIEFNVATADTNPMSSGGACEVNCNSHYRLQLSGNNSLTEQYKQYCVEWSSLDLPRVPSPKPFDPKTIVHMEWKFPANKSAPTNGTLCVDDVSFMK